MKNEPKPCPIPMGKKPRKKQRPTVRLDVHVTLDEDQLKQLLCAFEHLAESINAGVVKL